MGTIRVGKKSPKTAGQEAQKQKKMSILPAWEKEAIIEEAVKIAKEQVLAELVELGVILENAGENDSEGEGA